jgi:hypothetical protein
MSSRSRLKKFGGAWQQTRREHKSTKSRAGQRTIGACPIR